MFCKFLLFSIMMVVVREGSAAPGSWSSTSSSGFVFDPIAEGCVFGSVGNVVLPSATPEDIVAYVGPRLRATLHSINGPLQLFDVVRQYQNHHGQLFPMPPAASVATVVSWLPGFALEENGHGQLVYWGEFPDDTTRSPLLVWPAHAPLRLTRHHPDGLTDGSEWSSASSTSSSSASDPEVSALHLASPPSSPVFRQSPVTARRHYCNSSVASSSVGSQRLPQDYFNSSSSSSSSPLHAFAPVRDLAGHWARPSPRYSSRRSSSAASSVSAMASTQLASPGTSGMRSPSSSVHLDASPSCSTSRRSLRGRGDRPLYRLSRERQFPTAPAPSPSSPSSSDLVALVAPSFVHDVRAAVVSLLIVLQHCTIPS